MIEKNFKQQLIGYSIRQKIRPERAVDLYVREGIIDRFSHSLLNQKYVLKGASAFQVITQKQILSEFSFKDYQIDSDSLFLSGEAEKQSKPDTEL